jgi:outer membrane receptor protein involved in Fe transport
LSANAGLRYENVDLSSSPNITGVGVVPFDRNYNDWIASLGLTYALTDELRLVGGYYEGFRAPTIDDLVATKIALQNVQTEPRIGNLAINPEQTRTYETGVKWNGERLRLQAYEWWTHFDSYIGRETIAVNNVPTEFLSNQEAYLNGTEAYAEYLLNGGWSVYGNGAYTYGKITTNGQPFPRIPPLQGTVGLRWRDSARPRYFDIYTWLVDQVEQKHYNQFNLSDVRFIAGGTPGYGTLNLRAGTALGSQQNHKLSVALENITDQYYRVLGSGVDGAGFNAILGYEYVR